MAIKFLLHGISAVAIATMLPSCSKADDMVQVSCDIDERTADVFFSEAAKIGMSDAERYSISFQKAAIAMRFPPAYYSVRWSAVEGIIFAISHKSDTAGLLLLQFRGEQPKAVGIVELNCWRKAKQFIKENNIGLKLVEPPGVPG